MDDALAEEVVSAGITARHERMDNGELRFRLVAADGTGYIRTVAGPTGGWQHSHVHDSVLETYIVQSGWAAMATMADGELDVRLLLPADVETTQVGVAHNLYLPAGAVVHTVKHGEGDQDDWRADEALDRLTRNLTEEDLRRLLAPPAPTT